MKRLLLYLLFLSPIFSEAQTSVYHPFPEDSAKWCASVCGNEGNSYDDVTDELSGKTLINGMWYSRLLHYERSCFGAGFCMCASLYNEGVDTFYIRQDIAQKKVWLYVDSLNADTIFLDFDLYLGDTINSSKAYWAGLYAYSGVISFVDSVLIGTQYRMRYRYENQSFANRLIEGIGPTHGFFYNANIGYDHMQTLGTFLQDNHLYYPNYSPTPVNMNNYCYNFSTGIAELNQTSFSIFPNPAHDKLNVECSLQNAELKIYDVTGREVYSTTLNAKHETLNLSLSPALYFVRVENHTQKLIIE